MNSRARHANLFLLELVCSLFLFALCACVCVGLILHAQQLNRESRDLTQAVYLAQTAAEEWRAGTLEHNPGWCGPDAGLPEFQGDGCLLFDQSGASISREQAPSALETGQVAYSLILTRSLSPSGAAQATVSVLSGWLGEQLFALEVSMP